MNLTNFLKRTDALTAEYSAEQLRTFIHDFARVLPEHQRDDFLQRLEAAGKGTKKAAGRKKNNDSDFSKRFQKVTEILKRIDSQETAISSTLNEEYDDWYQNGEEFFYEDEEGVSDMISEACAFIHTCLDEERYKEGLQVGSQLFSMYILCTSEYGDEELTIEDLVYHNLLECDVNRVMLDTLCCAYRAVPLEKRAETLYTIFTKPSGSRITLEAVMQHGDGELPELSEFLNRWITFLGDKESHDADRLIAEAIYLLNDFSLACDYAKKFADTHPGLYLNILENEELANSKDMAPAGSGIGRKVPVELSAVGIEAMKSIPKKYTIRSKAALKTAEYMLQLDGKQKSLETCYCVAYESDTSAVNYLRALLNSSDAAGKRKELQKVPLKMPAKEAYRPQGERRENVPDCDMVWTLRFLDGQFADVLTRGLNQPEMLGWSYTFMKQGIALFLLLCKDGEWKEKGILRMSQMAAAAMGFTAGEYQKGLPKDSDVSEEQLFYDVFSKWKSMVVLEPEFRDQAIKRIGQLLVKRIEAIMNGNYRKYYDECAAYIAALGEVQESLGEIGAKQRLMSSYKEKYCRRSAFRSAMMEYGWLDEKKK